MQDHKWIENVLSDVEAYAEEHGLEKTAEVLPLVKMIVRNEISEKKVSRPFPAFGDNFAIIQGGIG